MLLLSVSCFLSLPRRRPHRLLAVASSFVEATASSLRVAIGAGQVQQQKREGEE